jgi:hypothetical protein
VARLTPIKASTKQEKVHAITGIRKHDPRVQVIKTKHALSSATNVTN